MSIIKDEELRKKKSNYWHPIKGVTERWRSSWNNRTNPIKAALDLNLLSLVPGLNLAQVIYDTLRDFLNVMIIMNAMNYDR